MNKLEMYIPSNINGKRVHVIHWQPEGETIGVLQLVHGMCEYIDRYDEFARLLAERGIAVMGHDHLGHGLSAASPEELGHFADDNAADALLNDMHAVTLLARQEYPNAVNFILGHSMGSFFVRRYITLFGRDVAGAIVMGTGWVPAAAAKAGKLLARQTCALRGPRHKSKVLASLVLGASEKAFAAEGPLAWLSVNQDNVRRYEADPLCGFPFTAGAYRDFFDIMDALATGADYDDIPRGLPVLVVSGAEDPVGGSAAVAKVAAQYRSLGLTDVTDKVFPGDRHEILNENDREAVYEYLCGWLLARC